MTNFAPTCRLRVACLLLLLAGTAGISRAQGAHSTGAQHFFSLTPAAFTLKSAPPVVSARRPGPDQLFPLPETWLLPAAAKPLRAETRRAPQPDEPAQVTTPPATSNSNDYVRPTKQERARRYLLDIAGPLALLGVGVAAGFDQGSHEPVEWGQGAAGYGKRYASRLGQNAIQQTVTYGLSEALRQDSAFHKSERHSFGERLGDALAQNITSRTATGRRVLSASRLAGFYVGGLVPAVTWYPDRFGYKDGLRQGTYSLAFGFGVNVLREFIFRR